MRSLVEVVAARLEKVGCAVDQHFEEAHERKCRFEAFAGELLGHRVEGSGFGKAHREQDFLGKYEAGRRRDPGFALGGENERGGQIERVLDGAQPARGLDLGKLRLGRHAQAEGPLECGPFRLAWIEEIDPHGLRKRSAAGLVRRVGAVHANVPHPLSFIRRENAWKAGG